MNAIVKKHLSLALLVIALLSMTGGWIGLSSEMRMRADYVYSDTMDLAQSLLYPVLNFDLYNINSESKYGAKAVKLIAKALDDYQLSPSESGAVLRNIVTLDKIVQSVNYLEHDDGLGWQFKLTSILFNIFYYVTMVSLIAVLVLRLLKKKDWSTIPLVGICILFAFMVTAMIYVNDYIEFTEITVLSLRVWPFITLICMIMSIVLWKSFQNSVVSGVSVEQGNGLGWIKNQIESGAKATRAFMQKGWTCNKCKAECSASAEFCKICGSKRPEPKVCAQCNTTILDNAIFCPKCGLKYEKVTFCGFCGRTLIDNETCNCQSVHSGDTAAENDY